MSQVVPFRYRPTQLRLVRPGARGTVLQFPYRVMKRRLAQCLLQDVFEITQARRQREARLLGDDC